MALSERAGKRDDTTPRTWLITGVSSGFGRELTEQLLERGQHVVGTVRRAESVGDLAQRYADQFRPELLDVTDTGAIRDVRLAGAREHPGGAAAAYRQLRVAGGPGRLDGLRAGRVTGRPSPSPRGSLENDMQITRNSIETVPGPGDWFTGTVYFDAVATPAAGSRLSAVNVHFSPGARTAWHTHPNGQTIYVLEGIGLCQRRGGPVEIIRPGDRVFFEPGEDHWHGAAPDRFMTHLAMLEVDEEGNSATWGEHVTDEEYRQTQQERGR